MGNHREHTGVTAGKIGTWETAAAWRRTVAGPVVFTNGVFDLLHPGHVVLLEEARRLGAVLCVGVNSDISVRALRKAPDRPVNTAAARARVVAGLEAVDAVVLFDEPTPADLIARLAPDLLVKGDDYQPQDLPGADTVTERGGRVICLPTVPGFSTTAIMERIRDTA